MARARTLQDLESVSSARTRPGARSASMRADSTLSPCAATVVTVERAVRIVVLGDAGVSRTLRLLVGIISRVPSIPATINPADARLLPFIDSVTGYHSSLEAEIRAMLGPAALRLLPATYEASADRVAASGTVVLFLFNASLDRPTLGARESALRELAGQLDSPERLPDDPGKIGISDYVVRRITHLKQVPHRSDQELLLKAVMAKLQPILRIELADLALLKQ